jgi:hypothetical protein
MTSRSFSGEEVEFTGQFRVYAQGQRKSTARCAERLIGQQQRAQEEGKDLVKSKQTAARKLTLIGTHFLSLT